MASNESPQPLIDLGIDEETNAVSNTEGVSDGDVKESAPSRTLEEAIAEYDAQHGIKNAGKPRKVTKKKRTKKRAPEFPEMVSYAFYAGYFFVAWLARSLEFGVPAALVLVFGRDILVPAALCSLVSYLASTVASRWVAEQLGRFPRVRAMILLVLASHVCLVVLALFMAVWGGLTAGSKWTSAQAAQWIGSVMFLTPLVATTQLLLDTLLVVLREDWAVVMCTKFASRSYTSVDAALGRIEGFSCIVAPTFMGLYMDAYGVFLTGIMLFVYAVVAWPIVTLTMWGVLQRIPSLQSAAAKPYERVLVPLHSLLVKDRAFLLNHTAFLAAVSVSLLAWSAFIPAAPMVIFAVGSGESVVATGVLIGTSHLMEVLAGLVARADVGLSSRGQLGLGSVVVLLCSVMAALVVMFQDFFAGWVLAVMVLLALSRVGYAFLTVTVTELCQDDILPTMADARYTLERVGRAIMLTSLLFLWYPADYLFAMLLSACIAVVSSFLTAVWVSLRTKV